MSVVEQNHAPLCRALGITCTKAPDLLKKGALQMVVKSINESVCHNSLIPILLVLLALSRLELPNDVPTPSTFKRAVAL